MKASKVLSTIASIVLWIVILVAALFAFTTLATRNQDNVSRLAGYTPLTVETDSMAPTFYSGDLIIIKKVDPSSLEVGDIITFHTIIQNQYALNTHRISEINESAGVRTYTTKGDNNAIADTHIISDNDIVGQYVARIPGFGKVIEFLSSSIGFLLIIVLPMLIFFIYQVYHLITVSITLKKAEALELAEEQARIAAKAQAQANAGAQGAQGGASGSGGQAAAPSQDDIAKQLEAAQAALAEAQRLKAEYEAKLAASDNSTPKE